jgi:D-amino peptidase
MWGCPVVLVTGDAATCPEATALLGDGLTTVAVKDGTGRFGARNLAPQRARELIEEGARTALRDLKAVPPYDPGRPCEIRVVFHHTDGVDAHRRKPGVEITGPRELVSRGDDWWSAWQQFFL